MTSKSNKKDSRQIVAEILIVGNELLNGTTLDTNSHWMSQELTKLGVMVARKTTIRDEMDIIVSTFKECFRRKPDWIFSIGGLGPTYDDMTIEGLANSIGKELFLDDSAIQMLKDSYERRRKMFNNPIRRMPKASLKMAMIPRGATALYNSVGSAAGVLLKVGKTQVVSLPGVPSEMKAIFTEELIPLIQPYSSKIIHAEEWLELIGTSESRLSTPVARISKKYSPLLYVKSHPMGFENGKSVIHVQLILTSDADEKEKSILILEKAASEMITAAKKLGANVKAIKSVR
ncbi:MAG TPA: molybdopterin-binding protein [Nitrososphaerales archaeon]|nr:molybdopterin-binding protein [Nitrososphaerales archaeon]